ncbi:pentapeptide repeat-containing protein [Legionella sp. WA2022007384]
MKDKQDLNQREQMAKIREQRARRFAEQKAKEEAKELLIVPTKIEEDEDEDMNQSNPFLALPDEMMMYILGQVSPQNLLNVRLMTKSKKGVVEATLDRITRPHFIIKQLSHMDGVTGHQFTAFYQKTRRYQELKRKVLAKESLTADEVICYTLTRDCNVLPANLKHMMHKIKLDKNTRRHLELIITISDEIHAFNNKLIGMMLDEYSLEYINKMMKQDIDKFMDRITQHHPGRFVNLLAGADFSSLQFRGKDFSYLNLRGVRFSDADLRDSNFKGAFLADVDLNGALLRGADLTDTSLSGTQLLRASLDGVDLSTNNLEKTDFEWTFIRNVTFLPVEALNSPEELHVFLSQFEKNSANHSAASRRKLQEQMLQDIANQIELSTEHSLKEKIALLDVALSVINPEQITVGLFSFQNACHVLKEQLAPSQLKQAPDHPLKKEAQEIIERILDLLNGKGPVSRRQMKRKRQPGPMRVNESAFFNEYERLVTSIAKYPELDNSIKISEALGISLETWHMLYLMCFNQDNRPKQLPVLADFHCATHEKNDGEERHYASEVFNGYLFEIQHLKKIQLQHLGQYLYKEEDFVIFEGAEIRVKLGDLFMSFRPGNKGGIDSTIEIIDFLKRERKPAFPVNFARFGNIPFEAFIPLESCVKYGGATSTNQELTVEDVRNFEEAYVLKRQIIERIFAFEKFNRQQKENLFFPFFEPHQDRGNSYKGSPMTGVKTNKRSMPPPLEKEKEFSRKENQHSKSSKLAAPKGQGLFSATQKEVAQERTVLDASPKTNIPEQRGQPSVQDEAQDNSRIKGSS